ncbi:MAG: DNA mismatch repair protein MutS [Alphaproteobacteria bacterium]|nr:DNA mismatch repair protein MutS [Alphaproteobacteria bacterium]
MVKDAELFAAAMAGVKPLRSRRPAARPAVVIATPKAERSAKPLERSRARPPTIMADLAAADGSFDRDVSRSLARGKLLPQASLDLHGMTLTAAERAVGRFLEEAAARDLRVVLIVTGKGLRLDGGRLLGGRIRAEFVGWLNRADNRQHVRAVRPAHARHGGGGAFYLLLRRRPSANRSAASSRSLRATPQR